MQKCRHRKDHLLKHKQRGRGLALPLVFAFSSHCRFVVKDKIWEDIFTSDSQGAVIKHFTPIMPTSILPASQWDVDLFSELDLWRHPIFSKIGNFIRYDPFSDPPITLNIYYYHTLSKYTLSCYHCRKRICHLYQYAATLVCLPRSELFSYKHPYS